jgi:hypothetical protein
MLGRGILWCDVPGKPEFRADPRFAALIDRIDLRERWVTCGWADKSAPEGGGGDPPRFGVTIRA